MKNKIITILTLIVIGFVVISLNCDLDKCIQNYYIFSIVMDPISDTITDTANKLNNLGSIFNKN